MKSALLALVILGLLAAAWFGGGKWKEDQIKRKNGGKLPHE